MAAAAMHDSGHILARCAELIRIRDWWEFKLSPLLAIFYGAAFARGAPLLPLAPQALLLLLAVTLCAAFVSAINDASDIEVDALAGKPNPAAEMPPAARAASIALPAVGGLAIAFIWRRDVPLLLAYLGSYAAFILYSLPPARLKGKGGFGVAADAAGAHLFPTLTALLLVWKPMAVRPDPVLLAAGAAWGLAFGVRGILWHQLGDVEADRRAGVRTLPRILGVDAARRFGERIVFPIELVALAALLWRMDAALAGLSLALYAATLVVRFRRFSIVPALVQPRPGAAIAFHQFYGFWLPVAIILQSALSHPADLLLLLLHAMLFPGGSRRAAAELWGLRPGAPAGLAG